MNSQASSTDSQADGDSETSSNSGASGGGSAAFAAALAKEVQTDSGEDAGGGEGDEGDEGKAGESRKALPGDLNGLAERLGVDVAKLYEVKIPLASGREPLTLGKIKDQLASWDTLETDRIAFDESKTKQEADLETARQEFRELLTLIPREALNKDNLARVAATLAKRNEANQARVIEGIPEWKSAERRAADMTEISEHLSGYGFDKKHAASITDVRLLKVLRDSARREKQIRKALAAVTKVPAKKATQQSSSRAAPRVADQPRTSQRPTTERARFSEALKRN